MTTVTPIAAARRRSRVVVGLALVLLGLVVTLFARTSVVVLGSASMQPWAAPGALLLHESVPTEALRPGDVVTITLADGTLVTHRVVDVQTGSGGTTATLQGDANPDPDAAVYGLGARVDRVTRVVPGVGGVLRVALPLVTGAVGLLLAGAVALRLAPGGGRRRGPAPASVEDRAATPSPADDTAVAVLATRPTPTTGPPTASSTAAPTAASPTTAPLDPRVEALTATVEQLEEDGLHPVLARDLVRVRTGTLVGAPPLERSPAAQDLDDAARFYLVALVDADPGALAIVRPRGAARLAGSIAVGHWWLDVQPALSPAVAAAVAPWVTRTD